MKIFVCVKQVPDTETLIEIKDGRAVDESRIKWVVNPYDEFAVEEAIRFKEKTPGHEVVLVSIGPERAVEALRPCLAMGADRAIHVVSSASYDPIGIARGLAAAIRKDEPAPRLVLAGKQAIDDDACQVPFRLAHHLGLSVAPEAVSFALEGESAVISRDAGGGTRETLEAPLPALVTVTKGINTPRYPKLPDIMKAKMKPLLKLAPADVGLEGYANAQETLAMTLPPGRKAGEVYKAELPENVDRLVKSLTAGDAIL